MIIRALKKLFTNTRTSVRMKTVDTGRNSFCPVGEMEVSSFSDI